jgi:hypothetical protein
MVESDEPSLDFSFVDLVSKTVVLLYNRETLRGETYNLLNPNKVSLNELTGMLREIGVDLQMVLVDEFLDILQNNYKNPGLREYIEKIILHTNLFSDSDGSFIKLVSQKTDLILNRLGFCWLRLNKKHVEKMLSYCQEVGFI